MTDSDDGPDGGREGGTAIREADVADALDVRRVLDGAMLEVPGNLEDRIRAGEVLVSTDDGVVTGALVLDGNRAEAVAVRRRRRGRGVGSALVETAAGRAEGALTAEFREEIAPFYESLGFEIEAAAGTGRLCGSRHERRD